jgi:putative transposase
VLVSRAYRHKARFSPEQEALARRFAGCARLVYNAGLEQRRLGYTVTGQSMSYMAQTYGLKAVKADPDFTFLRECPAHVLQQALRDLDRAYQNFFAGRAGFPRPRRRGERDSFRYPDPDPKQIGVHDPSRQGQVRLPKLGWMSVINCWPRLGARLFEGKLKTVTVTRQADGWWISFSCEVEIPEPTTPAGGPVGLDLGITNSVATSNGELIGLPIASDREWEKIAILQQRIARKQRGSRNREKAVRRLARRRHRLACRKRDEIHKLTTRLAREHEAIIIEDLKVKNMSASARGTVEQPGRQVRQKAGLNRAILDQCWGETRRQLAYKTAWNGGTLIAIDPRYTSQTCPACGHVAPDNRESQAVFRCVTCGHQAHADVNAATNILDRGLSSIAVRTAGTADPDPSTGSNACDHEHAVKTPERARPSRKARSRDQARITPLAA